MKREFLQGLELEGGVKLPKDVVDQIMDEHGKDITALQQRYGDYDDLKARLKTANDTIKSFKDMDIEGIRAGAEEYKKKYEQAQKESQAKIAQLQFDSALELALAGSGAKNAKALKGLLDIDKIKLEDGQLTGFDAQLEAIKKDNDYLFNDSPAKTTGMAQGGSPDNEDAFIAAVRAGAGLK